MPDSGDTRSGLVATLRAAGCVFAEDEARLLESAAKTEADLTAMVDQRVAGLPLEHLLGDAEFYGLHLAVAPGVFVPRRRTELLVHHATALTGSGAVVVDLCCGCGALGAALLTTLDSPELHAVELDPAAARCARRNLAGSGQVYVGDLYEPLPAALRGRVEVVVANVPYVPTDAIDRMPPEARLHEPQVALDGGVDGLDFLRRVAAAAPSWLAPGGHLLIETSGSQAPKARETFSDNGLIPRVASSEELDATAVIGTRPDTDSDVPTSTGRGDGARTT